MKEALKQVSNLVERFQENIEAYRNPAYNETQLRIEFIDPFFEALGWDVANKAGYAEQYKDVVHEDAIKIAGATKAPDYCFRIGGVRKFFLETKKPSVDIKDQTGPGQKSLQPRISPPSSRGWSVRECCSQPMKWNHSGYP